MSTAFASLCFLMRIPTPFTPLKRLTVTWSCTPSSTSAISPNRTTELPFAEIIRFLKSSTDLNFPEKRTVICSDTSFNFPVGNSTFDEATAWFIPANERPYIFILSLSTFTRNSRFSPPIT